jgi:hypothetical protein
MNRLGSMLEATNAAPMTAAREVSRCSLTNQRGRITGKSHLSGQSGRLLGSLAIGVPTPEI